jgi:hypothetical protein
MVFIEKATGYFLSPMVISFCFIVLDIFKKPPRLGNESKTQAGGDDYYTPTEYAP